MFDRLLKIAALWLVLASPALASQTTLVTPASPLPMTSLASFLNNALLSIGSCNSGNSAPTNGTGSAAFNGECWINTTANPWVFSYTSDAVHWSEFGTLNTSTFVWTPYSNNFSMSLGGNFSTAGAFTQAGAFPLTLTVTATTNSTLPAGTHTLGGLDVSQTWSGTNNFTSTFQINGNAMTFPGVAATLGALGVAQTWSANQTFSGTVNHTGPFQISGTAESFPASGNLVGTTDTQTLTGKTVSGASNTLTVQAGSQLTGQTPVANGGTGQSTANAARQASGLNVYGDQGSGYGNTAQVLANTDRFAYTTTAFTASHAWTLPAANVTGAPYTVKIADLAGGVTATNTLVITRAGSDTINGGTTATISAANGGYECSSDGSSKWSCLAMGAASGGGVSSVTCNGGLSGGAITTSGTCALALTNTTLQASPSNPTATSTTTPGVMMGLGSTCKLTPTYSGRISLTFIGTVSNTAANTGTVVQAKYGTGTAPANGVAPAGTSIGANVQAATLGSTGGWLMPFQAGGIITGLTPGTAYWFDLNVAVGANTGSVAGISCTAMEF